MIHILRISYAASLAFHGVVLLARFHKQPLAVGNIARVLKVSEAHLSKVMQRLSKAGIVSSSRGPRGGFRLSVKPGETNLMVVYEAIEGPLPKNECFLGTPVCKGDDCVLGNLHKIINDQVETYLTQTHLSDLTKIYDGVEL